MTRNFENLEFIQRIETARDAFEREFRRAPSMTEDDRIVREVRKQFEEELAQQVRERAMAYKERRDGE